MPHGYAVVNGNSVELCRIAAQGFYLALYYLTYLMQMGVTWHKLSKGVDYCYYWLAKLFALHSVGHPQGAGTGHSSSFCANSTA